MKAVVVCDDHGVIHSVTRAVPHPKRGVGVVATSGYHVVEVSLPEELENTSLHTIHRNYCVDLSEKKLVSRT